MKKFKVGDRVTWGSGNPLAEVKECGDVVMIELLRDIHNPCGSVVRAGHQFCVSSDELRYVQ